MSTLILNRIESKEKSLKIPQRYKFKVGILIMMFGIALLLPTPILILTGCLIIFGILII